MFYDKYKSLCAARGISCNRAALDMGLSNATPSKWKKTGATPDGKTLALLSAYFGVPVSYLLDTKDSPSIGQRIKEARVKAGLTQSQLSEILDVSSQCIGLWERDIRKPTPEVISKIAAALLVEESDLTDSLSYDTGWRAGFSASECENQIFDELLHQDGYTFSEEESRLIGAFSTLNALGRQKAIERVEELTEISKYQNT